MRAVSFVAGVLLAVVGAIPGYGQSPTITYPAGSYTLTFPTPVQIVTTSNSVTFTWGAPAPPTPTPVPVPPAPTPVPVLTGHVWAIALCEPGKPLAPAQDAVFRSATLKAAALGLDIDWLPHTTTDAAIASWLAHVPASGYPALILAQAGVDGKGISAYAGPLPADEAGIVALLSKVRGK